MSVEVFSERKALVLQWEAGDYEGPVTIKTESDNDVSSTELVSNPGYAAVSFPLEHTGSFEVQVVDPDGNVIDYGAVEVS